MGSAITTIIVEFTAKDGREYAFQAEGADLTIWKEAVHDEFGHFIDEGNLKGFLEAFNDFDYVLPSIDTIYDVIASQMGGLDNMERITFDYKKVDPYGDGDDNYFVILKGEPQQSVQHDAKGSSNKDYIFDKSKTRVCKDMLEINYKNSTLESILKEFDYSRDGGDNTSILMWEGVPEYYGVKDLTSLTKTLIAMLIRTGEGRDGYEQALVDAFEDIKNGFSFLEGTAAEKRNSRFYEGYDFELKNGDYQANYRKCYGGW